MFFEVLTLFPGMFSGPLDESIIGLAREKELIEFNAVDIRNYTLDKHNVTDDYSYGGGAGMVMKVGPITRALESVEERREGDYKTILLSPQGKRLNQEMVKNYSSNDGLILICGRYEGVDERVREHLIDEEVSIGDFVLTGGELPAMVLIDAVSRMIPGVLGDSDSKKEDSFYHGLLDYPHYTRPRSFRGWEVPDILLSGDHARVDHWRKKESLKRTYLRRPDLIEAKTLSEQEKELLAEIRAELEGENDEQ